MLRGYYHIGRAKEGIAPGGVYLQTLGVSLYGEYHLSALAAAYPVLLLYLYALYIVQIVKIVYEPLCVLRDLEHPLAAHLLNDYAAAALTHAVHHLLVGQAHLAGGAEVYGYLSLVRETLLEKLQKYPLGPFVVVGIRGVYLAAPVKAEAQPLELCAEVLYVVVGDLGRVYAGLYGIVLGRQAECVPAYGVKHVIPLHAPLSGDYIQSGVGSGMPYMKAMPGGIRELYQGIELGH